MESQEIIQNSSFIKLAFIIIGSLIGIVQFFIIRYIGTVDKNFEKEKDERKEQINEIKNKLNSIETDCKTTIDVLNRIVTENSVNIAELKGFFKGYMNGK